MRAISKSFFILICFLFITSIALSQWQVDQTYGMKINIPSDWSKNSFKDGTDQVYEFYSADQTVAVQLRAFAADPSLTMELLIQVYEQAMLPAAANRLSLNDHTSVQGIPGKQAVYQLNQGGTLISLAAFYVIQKGNAYILTAIIPNEVIEQKSAEIKGVTQSFTINGINPPTTTQAPKALPKPPGQNTGARPQPTNSDALPSASSQSSVTGTYKFVSRSDGKVLTNYHKIVINSNGTYEESYEPKHSPGYKGGNSGSWTQNGNTLTLTHQGGSVSDSYLIKGNELHRTTQSGVTFIFRK